MPGHSATEQRRQAAQLLRISMRIPVAYTATLTATDSVGDISNANVIVTVNDVPPTVTLNDSVFGTNGGCR